MKRKILKISLLVVFLVAMVLPLALTCFAYDEHEDVIYPSDWYPNWADYIDIDRVGIDKIEQIGTSFLSLYSSKMGYAGSLLLSRASNIGEVMDFFKHPALLCGAPSFGGINSIVKPNVFGYVDGDGTYSDFVLYGTCTVALVYGHYTDYQTKVYNDVACRYSLLHSSDGYTVAFDINIEGDTDSVVYKSTNILRPLDSLALDHYTFDGVSYTASDGQFYIAVMPEDDNSISLLSALAPLFFGSEADDFILYPLFYAYNMLVSPYIQNIYDGAYDDGFNEGVYVGENSSSLYQEGYNDALKEIDSGQFGKNFLGSVISSPFEVLRNFVLVEWTTANGRSITFNLMTLFSASVGLGLFVWFLKTFAGG